MEQILICLQNMSAWIGPLWTQATLSSLTKSKCRRDTRKLKTACLYTRPITLSKIQSSLTRRELICTPDQDLLKSTPQCRVTALAIMLTQAVLAGKITSGIKSTLLLKRSLWPRRSRELFVSTMERSMEAHGRHQTLI